MLSPINLFDYFLLLCMTQTPNLFGSCTYLYLGLIFVNIEIHLPGVCKDMLKSINFSNLMLSPILTMLALIMSTANSDEEKENQVYVTYTQDAQLWSISRFSDIPPVTLCQFAQLSIIPNLGDLILSRISQIGQFHELQLTVYLPFSNPFLLMIIHREFHIYFFGHLKKLQSGLLGMTYPFPNYTGSL